MPHGMQGGMRTPLSTVAAVTAILALIGLGGLLAVKHGLQAMARSRAEAFLARSEPDRNSQAFLIDTTRRVHEAFRASEGRPFGLLERLRPYLSNAILPGFLRLRPGAMDVIAMHGHCDNSARALKFMLEEAGYRAWQFNMVSPDMAHTVTLAEGPNGTTCLLDPMFAVAPMSNGRLIGPRQARELARAGAKPPELQWSLLAPSSSARFYTRFADTSFARQGSQLVLRAEVTLPAGGRIALGVPDGQSHDVSDAAAKRGWTPHWHYIGNKFDRSWDRIMTFHQKTRLVLHLLSPPDERFITTIDRPEIKGNELIYTLDKGESLLFDDGSAGRDWLRLHSFQDVDFITLEALP